MTAADTTSTHHHHHFSHHTHSFIFPTFLSAASAFHFFCFICPVFCRRLWLGNRRHLFLSHQTRNAKQSDDFFCQRGKFA